MPQLGQVRWGSVLIFLTTPPRPQPKAAPSSAERCELGQHSSWRTVFLLHEQSSVAPTLAHQIGFQNKFPAARVPWRRRLREALRARADLQAEAKKRMFSEALSARAEPGNRSRRFPRPSGPNTMATLGSKPGMILPHEQPRKTTVSGWEPYKKTGSGGVLACAIGAHPMAFLGAASIQIVDGVEVDLRKAITPRRRFLEF